MPMDVRSEILKSKEYTFRSRNSVGAGPRVVTMSSPTPVCQAFVNKRFHGRIFGKATDFHPALETPRCH